MEVAAAVVSIQEQTHVAEARRRAAERAAQLGFQELAAGRLAIVVTEVATNLLKHAGGGDVLIGPAAGRGGVGVQVLALDRGRGMGNVTAHLRDGYSTAGTAGTGLGAIARAATRFDIHSVLGRGTVVGACVYPDDVQPLSMGAVSVPMPGETECGDGWAAWSAGALTSLIVCDGLGHGAPAASATAIALATFRRHAERSAADVLSAIHDALRSTRGAAVAVVEIDHRQRTLRFCGIGNISASVQTPEKSQHLVSLPGIAGHMVRRVQPFSYPWPPGSVLVMHSDGIGSHWSLASHEGLMPKHPPVVAGALLRDHRRGRDDATVLVFRSEDAA